MIVLTRGDCLVFSIFLSAVVVGYVSGLLSAAPALDASAEMVDYRIDLNTASVSEMALVRGISRSTAQKIAWARRDDGPFKSMDDLHERFPRAARWEDAVRLSAKGP